MTAIDPRLLQHYNRELGYLRRQAAVFSEDHAQVAGRLGLDAPTNPDPHVERLLEGVAYLNARVRLKLDDQFPDFTQYLLDALYPQYVTPTPAMGIVTLTPTPGENALADGPRVARGSTVHATLSTESITPVEFRTGQDVTLWPLKIIAADYLATRAAVATATGTAVGEAALRLRLELTIDGSLADLAIDHLDLFIDGAEDVPGRLLHQLLAESYPALVCASDRGRRDAWSVGAGPVEALGLDAEQALLPADLRSFRGYRLLAEYYAMPEKFRFIRLTGLAAGFARGARQVDIVIPLKRCVPALAAAVATDNFRLHATPVINLYKRHFDRIPVDRGQPEHLVLADRSRQQDHEIYSLTSVSAYRAGDSVGMPVQPLYARNAERGDQPLYYSLRRRLRRLSEAERRRRRESDYTGSETWIALTAPGAPGLVDDIAEIAAEGWVTNRALPTRLRPGAPDLVLALADMANVAAVRMIRGPTRPQPPLGLGDAAWRVVSHLAPGNRGFARADGSPDVLLDHLRLYLRDEAPALRREIQGITGLHAALVTRRAAGVSRLAFERGEQLTLHLAASAYEASTAYLFTMVVARFLAEFATVNSFAEVIVKSDDGLSWRWPALSGPRPTI
ncbi:type VI secretion system baseplate subunit TssF [Polymorphobacter fuscus]|uniref:Type VI secretion system baseplate subunit TssF n=1 Tax=Sandarakinorhabdus fusca TaxID=1439888 RepID=A0A7C9GSW7_9SPHN|nr:type VI secretion system baseplate subunit TssF [Polymorphobacter fuscus]KAB7648280.1 type VI secretion system baseplate subunit TssF [Polymorphobacter fuscus]MQT15789.1 type VI secretion system baseplate subunit TssF [Polymorphobacter fuscus]NJC07938.1 type VI secretion system protein ImpG [Polymorphobacter fuscus]